MVKLTETQEAFRVAMDKLLSERSLSNDWLGAAIGVTGESIRLKRKGERRVKFQEMPQIANAFGMTIKEMLAYRGGNIINLGDNNIVASSVSGNTAVVDDITRKTCEELAEAMQKRDVDARYALRRKVRGLIEEEDAEG